MDAELRCGHQDRLRAIPRRRGQPLDRRAGHDHIQAMRRPAAMRRNLVFAETLLLAVVSAGIAVATAAAAEPTGTTRVVDRDRVQCTNADFTSIQDAVDA